MLPTPPAAVEVTFDAQWVEYFDERIEFNTPLRLDRPRRCTLPITALRVTPPNSLAIWLADWPSPHIFFNSSTRSSVQDIRHFLS